MLLLNHLTSVFTQIRSIGNIFTQKLVDIPSSQKIIVVSVSASLALLGVLARYMRRKRQVVDPKKFRPWTGKRSRISGFRSPSGDVGSIASGSRRSEGGGGRTRPGSVVSERTSVASGSLAGGSNIGNATHLTPQQLGVMGMEALETSINYWEDALSSYTAATDGGPLAVLGAEEAAFCRDLQLLLDAAYALQDQSELLFLDQMSVLFRPDSAEDSIHKSRHRSPSLVDSFASAVADLREFELLEELFGDSATDPPVMYQLALKHLEDGGGIPCRTVRTELVGCGSDSEYLAKLHCLRLAFQHMLRDPITWIWFAEAGRQTLADMLLYADRDPKDFLIAYESMLVYLRDVNNWPCLEEELCARGVKALTFYDVVLDYILMDAFEDLDSPPSSVTAVVQNRWLSNGFKETALTTAVWSVLKAKKQMLKFPSGFMAHFYLISERLLPLLAWGFLGPDESLRDTCVYFKEQVMDLLVDMFSFQECRFTNVDELAVDVLRHLKKRVGNVSQRLRTQ